MVSNGYWFNFAAWDTSDLTFPFETPTKPFRLESLASIMFSPREEWASKIACLLQPREVLWAMNSTSELSLPFLYQGLGTWITCRLLSLACNTHRNKLRRMGKLSCAARGLN